MQLKKLSFINVKCKTGFLQNNIYSSFYKEIQLHFIIKFYLILLLKPWKHIRGRPSAKYLICGIHFEHIHDCYYGDATLTRYRYTPRYLVINLLETDKTMVGFLQERAATSFKLSIQFPFCGCINHLCFFVKL